MPIIQHLIADTFGSHIGKYSERLKVTSKSEVLAQAPLLHLQTVSILNRGVSISADALQACCEQGIPVFFMDAQGNPYASIYAAGLAGTVITRREQLRAYDDARAPYLACAFALGKIQNQAITLRYMAKNRKDTPEGEGLLEAARLVHDHLARLDDLQGDLSDIRGQVLATEGHAAGVYWQAVRHLIPDEYAWHQREGRGATDPINSLLNYGYGILYGQIERVLVLAGLDPFAGFIHTDRPGKPSLVLDFIEEFRQTAVDRVVFGLATRQFQIQQDDQQRLSEDTRRSFADHVLSHLDTLVYYEGQRHPLKNIMQMQARRLAAFFRGERDTYVPFKAEA